MAFVVRNLLSALAIVVVLLVTSTPATVFVGMSERRLTRASESVVLGRVLDVEVRESEHGTPETVATIAVESALKGAPAATITVVQPGGMLDRRGLWIPGAPTFRAGERQVLFLSRHRSGRLRTTALGMGQFHVRLGEDGALVAERMVSEPVLGGQGTRRLRLDRLARLIERAAGVPATPVTAPSLAAPTRDADAFVLMDRPLARWFLPDVGLPIVFATDARGDRTLGIEASLAAVDAALAAWTDVPGSTIRLERGTDADPMPLLCDGVSQLVFNDPFGELGQPSSCSGVLAVGGYCTAGRSEATRTVGGLEFRRITEGNITFNNGFGRCPFWTAANLAEVVTHELGHTIGIGHSSEVDEEQSAIAKDATMYYRAHFDGRGASVRPDDMAAARSLYPGPMGDIADLDGDGVVDAVDNCPGDDPARAIANAGQSDLDGDGLGDLCDPCPVGTECGLIVRSTLRVRAQGGGTLVWTGALDGAVDDETLESARLELASADGVLIGGTMAGTGLGRDGNSGRRRVRRKLRFADGRARLRIAPPRRGRRKIRLVVRPFTPGDPSGSLVSANLALGDANFTGTLICRPHRRRLLDCRS